MKTLLLTLSLGIVFALNVQAQISTTVKTGTIKLDGKILAVTLNPAMSQGYVIVGTEKFEINGWNTKGYTGRRTIINKQPQVDKSIQVIVNDGVTDEQLKSFVDNTGDVACSNEENYVITIGDNLSMSVIGNCLKLEEIK